MRIRLLAGIAVLTLGVAPAGATPAGADSEAAATVTLITGDRVTIQSDGSHSMAAPHVSGAAAVLAQQHPDWTGAQLKAALMGSAVPNPRLSPFWQGSGRVDVAHAITQTVIAEPASLSLGVLPWPHDNDQPVTIAVPAGGTASVAVAADTSGVADGDHTGTVVATEGVRTPVAITRKPETYKLSVQFLGPDGKPTTHFFSVLQGLDNWTHEILHWLDDAGKVTLALPRGRYALDATVLGDADRMYYLPQPNVTLTSDTTITVDARRAKPVSITPPVEATLGSAWPGHGRTGYPPE
jgi:hypothetical protein